jgi:predicted ATPase
MPAPKRKVSRKVSRSKPLKAKPIEPVFLTLVQLRSFKAATSSNLDLGMFNVVIGRNGAGKSTLIEALQWIDQAIRDGARSASDRYHGIHDLINVQGTHRPHTFAVGLGWIRAGKKKGTYAYTVRVRETNERLPSIVKELLDCSIAGQSRWLIDTKRDGLRVVSPTLRSSVLFEDPDQLALSFASRIAATRTAVRASALAPINDFWSRAVFLRLSPSRLAQTAAPQRKPSAPLLDEEGHQLPALLNELSDTQRTRMVQKIEKVLADFKEIAVSKPASARDEEVFYSLIEEMPSGKTKHSTAVRVPIPAWMLSEGTRRLTALFALLHHDPPPSLLCIEEIENGLDPWTLLTVLKELQSASERGVQIIVTTHSPWLLDHVELSSILYVRRENGETRYERFADRKDVKAYQGKVPPGAIYVHEES